MRLKNISKNLTAKLTVNRINQLLRLKRFDSFRLIDFGYILPTPSWRARRLGGGGTPKRAMTCHCSPVTPGPTRQRGRQPRCTPLYPGTSQAAGAAAAAVPLHEQPRPTLLPKPRSLAYTWPHLIWGHLPVAAAVTRGVVTVAEAARARTEGAAHVAGARAPLPLLSSLASGNDGAALQKAHKSESRRGPPPHPLARARSTLPLCWLPLSPSTLFLPQPLASPLSLAAASASARISFPFSL